MATRVDRRPIGGLRRNSLPSLPCAAVVPTPSEISSEVFLRVSSWLYVKDHRPSSQLHDKSIRPPGATFFIAIRGAASPSSP